MAIAREIDIDLVALRKEFVIELIDLRKQYQEEYLKWAAEKLAAARKEFGRFDEDARLVHYSAHIYTETGDVQSRNVLSVRVLFLIC